MTRRLQYGGLKVNNRVMNAGLVISLGLIGLQGACSSEKAKDRIVIGQTTSLTGFQGPIAALA
jgi:ABC-type uncharacterized transport system permease subunit